jgi:hypothetical protein
MSTPLPTLSIMLPPQCPFLFLPPLKPPLLNQKRQHPSPHQFMLSQPTSLPHQLQSPL